MKQQIFWLMGLAMLSGCTSNPNAPVNQVWPIPQMDRAFGSPHPQSYSQSDASDYRERPGYLPAYPPYKGYQPYPPGTTVPDNGAGQDQ
jgi:hypothetical protein